MKKVILVMSMLVLLAGGVIAGEPGFEERPQQVEVAPIPQVEEIVVPQQIEAYEVPVAKEIVVSPEIEVSSEPVFKVKSTPKQVVITSDVQINEAPAQVSAQELVAVEDAPTANAYTYCTCLPICCKWPTQVSTSEVACVEGDGYLEKSGKKLWDGVTQTAFGWTPLFTCQTDEIEVASVNGDLGGSTKSFAKNTFSGVGDSVSKTGKGLIKTATFMIH